MMINHTLSYSYDKKGKHYFNINTYGATKAEIYEALIHKNTKNKVNKVLNNYIIGDSTFIEGRILIVKGKNFLTNERSVGNISTFTKRIYLNGDFCERIIIYDYDTGEIQYSKRTSKKEKLEDYENITDVFEEIYDVLSDFDGLPIGFHLITPAVSIISGESAIKEISKEEISLYSNRKNKEDLFSLMSQTFYIVKEGTNEIVGMISYNFEKENISYNIKSKFRGNHYASKALSLMLELLNQNIHICEYKLYVKVLKENIPSINTALRCNLPLVKSNDSVNFYLANHEKILTINKQ